jgi:hypothetical protein
MQVLGVVYIRGRKMRVRPEVGTSLLHCVLRLQTRDRQNRGGSNDRYERSERHPCQSGTMLYA